MRMASVVSDVERAGYEAMTGDLPGVQWRAEHQTPNQNRFCFMNPTKTRLGMPDREYIDVPQHLLAKEKLHPAKVRGAWYWMWTEPQLSGARK